MGLPKPPYYAVYITSVLSDDLDGYDELNAQMVELSKQQPGYLGREALPGRNGEERVVIYWADDESLKGWRSHPDHQVAMRAGRKRYYKAYHIRVTKVEREYGSRHAAPQAR